MPITSKISSALHDNSTLAAILAEALVRRGISEVIVTYEQVMEMSYRHVTITFHEDHNKDAYIIRLRDRRHDDQYVEYEIVQEPETLPPSQRLLKP